MILVTGANRHLRSMTIDHLFKKNPDTHVAALVRSEENGEDIKEKGVKKGP
ncbi:MAG: hypothetical protein RI575_14755 [Balneolaceae bacterium]|nr:hypothetical protein [Balneolaceae bacterium]